MVISVKQKREDFKMSYEMVARFTISMAVISKKTGEMLSRTLLAKNVDVEQAKCELDGRTSSDNSYVSEVLDNMVKSTKQHRDAFAIFYHPTENVEFYVSASELMKG
jgi:hypothetical protein